MDSKLANKLREGFPQSDGEKRPKVGDFTNIPTEDPRAALQFSQSLACMIAGFSSREHQIASGIRTALIVPEHQPELSVVIPLFDNDH